MRDQYRSISFLEKNDKKYQEYSKKMQFLRNTNRFIGESDSKQTITAWLERVMTMHISRVFIHSTCNILTWEELNSFNQYTRKYSEIDGLFNSNDGSLYIEVKASQSKSSLSKGKSQINKNLKLMTLISKNTIGILVMADCRCFDSSFGFSIEKIEDENTNSTQYKKIEGLDLPESFNSSHKWLWLLSQEDVHQLATQYGSPQTETTDPDYL